MKKIAIMFAFISAVSLNSNAQAVGSSAKPGSTPSGKCINKGNSLIDAYYGFPNLYASIFRAAYATAGVQGATVSSIGPIGGKYEYVLTEQFGIGAEFNYSNVKLTFTETNTNSSTGASSTYHYIYSSPAMRAMVGFNFHFVNTSAIDVYGAVKAGYYKRSFNFTSDYPGYVGIQSVSYPVPVAFRLELGMRYFFTDFLGAHVNIGIGGGPLVALGLSAKF